MTDLIGQWLRDAPGDSRISCPFKARAAVVNFQMHFCCSETAARDPQPICDPNGTGPIDAIFILNFKKPRKITV
jgi:hypothetical protein